MQVAGGSGSASTQDFTGLAAQIAALDLVQPLTT